MTLWVARSNANASRLVVVRQSRPTVKLHERQIMFEFIDEGDMEFVPRGRKSNVSPELVKALTQLKKGQACKLTGMKVDLKLANAKTEKARISATIRQASKQAKVAIVIRWSGDGTPQVVKKSA